MSSDSRIPGFYKLTLTNRRAELFARTAATEADIDVLDKGGLDAVTADKVVENAVGIYGLPLGLGLNFRINGRDYLVPMAVEEPSVIAAASNAARMVREGGGFFAEADAPVMTAQVELLDVAQVDLGCAAIAAHTDELTALAHALTPRLVQRGGGLREIEVRTLGTGADARIVVHLHIDCRDAMGANLVNTVAEGVAPRLAGLVGGRPGLRILTNLADRRLVRVQARVPHLCLAAPGFEGEVVAKEIASASRFAEDDMYRAATHNKGIMNGVDAVVIATGNDWRGVEAGAHAYACLDGRYRPLSTWRSEAGFLVGRLAMPMAVGTVGGTLGVHAGARLVQRVLGVRDAGELGTVIASVGLASNLAALRALATEGIQRGHMALHRKAVAGVVRRPGPTPPEALS